MPTPYDPNRSYTPHRNALRRVASSILGQSASTQLSPVAPRLDGRLALVTGGLRGIGLEITKGLACRGVDVIAFSRSGSTAQCVELSRETGALISFVSGDLGDLTSIHAAIEDIQSNCGTRQIDIFCANAGISPKKWSLSRDGYEAAFAINCLGHHALIRRLEDMKVLSSQARVVGVTGDIYVLASDCTHDFRYRWHGVGAYSRSKLGNLWQFTELARQRPEMTVVCVHPGVVATELEGGMTGVAGAFKRRFFISPEEGAQAALIAATQTLDSGAYFHNMRGEMRLRESDSAQDVTKAADFWKLLEKLAGSG